jgi:hypothetical protein
VKNARMEFDLDEIVMILEALRTWRPSSKSTVLINRFELLYATSVESAVSEINDGRRR